MKENKITTDKAPKPVGAYPHSQRVGNLLFLSGIGPRKTGTDEIPGLHLDDKTKQLKTNFQTHR